MTIANESLYHNYEDVFSRKSVTHVQLEFFQFINFEFRFDSSLVEVISSWLFLGKRVVFDENSLIPNQFYTTVVPSTQLALQHYKRFSYTLFTF